MDSLTILFYTLTILGTGTATYLLSTGRPHPQPPRAKLHGAGNCKYILDNSHSRTFKLPDGRTLGYAEYGDPNGKAILYQHGIPGSRIEATRYHELGLELGIRVISIDRPGYGWSTRFPRYRDRTVKSWGEDVEALVEHLELEEYAILGVSGGGPYALSCALHLPRTRLKALSLICGIGPPGISMRNAAWPTYIGFTIGWRWSPQFLLRWFFSRDAALSLHLSDDDRVRALLDPRRLEGTQGKDRAFFADEDEMRVYVATSREGFGQGFDGMCKDGFVMCTDWGFRVEDIGKDVPVVMWYGTEDVNVPPHHGRTIAARLAGEGEVVSEVTDNGPLQWSERVRLRMLDDTHASISMRDKRGYLVDILEAWGQ
ncbi:uncharacterized protein EKO05_0002657 [Ascochyta rabiei]|uniref:Uncharacterized protein n=1 Tax=Didymella rabiei TaxID=5454 RepID=A0A162ZR47_DIDRA|nr:uncharacterized protein EKO05_0002657 [Ascochyta rabiei]KZM20761.1 hypothetical protein ST47_g8108 [Ascochyta rabiei]UPX12084.1 hypothetical protein EKO05_0002657 [Ascochyta rabiei]